MKGTPIATSQDEPPWDTSHLSCLSAEEPAVPTTPVISATPRLRARYSESFQCIGSACEDTCCQGFTVPVEEATWEKYQSLPPSPFQILVEASVTRTSENAEGFPAGITPHYATIRMNSANECPLLTADRLCSVQSELGESFLSHTCATYPRIVHSVDGMKEAALTLSCPEAARHVLLNPNLMGRAGRSERQSAGTIPKANLAGFKVEVKASSNHSQPASATISSATDESATTLPPHFWEIREVILNLLRNRAYPLWQRLFLLGVLCRRLDSFAQAEHARTVPEFLIDFESTAATGALRPAMANLPMNPSSQLDVVLRLAGMMLHKSNVRARFVECIDAFAKGIGNGPGATLESLTTQYAIAHDRFYAPFFDKNPHITENFLVNTIVRCQFPFGKEGMKAGVQPLMEREFAMLTAQFTLMRGLLIGAAGHYGKSFSTAHIVHTVQAATKHFEHHPEFLSMAHTLLVESRMDGTTGLAILLRNAETNRPGMDRAAGESRPASPEISAPETQDGRPAWAAAPAGTGPPGSLHRRVNVPPSRPRVQPPQ
jgi:lysine-N-methylase